MLRLSSLAEIEINVASLQVGRIGPAHGLAMT
jgi:hypothetical protein